MKFAVVVNYAELHAFVYRPSVSRIITIRGNLRQIFIPFDSISRREILHLALITASFLDTHTARELHEPGDNRFKPEKPTWTEQLSRAITLHFRGNYRYLDRYRCSTFNHRNAHLPRLLVGRGRNRFPIPPPPLLDFPRTEPGILFRCFSQLSRNNRTRFRVKAHSAPHPFPLQSGIRFGNGWMLNPCMNGHFFFFFSLSFSSSSNFRNYAPTFMFLYLLCFFFK